MAEQAVGSDYHQVEQAVEAANGLVREQLQLLRAEQERLTRMLEVREMDLYQLRILMEDLSYTARAGAGLGDGAQRWTARIGTLQGKEVELRDSVELVSQALSSLNSLISAVSSISTLGRSSELGRNSDPLEAAIAGRTLQGQEAERSRLAREVHDGPAQVLANSIMALEYCERLLEKRPEAVPNELRRIKSTMSEGLEEVRRFIFDLRPSSLEHEGLTATIQKYATDFEHRCGMTVCLECDPVDDVLSSEQRFVIFRIVQEAMQNSRKHAVASRLDVRLERLEGHVGVYVRDNGRGFDLEINRFKEGHYGLQGMRERAESVQGSVVIFSEPGYGTEVRMRVPVSQG